MGLKKDEDDLDYSQLDDGVRDLVRRLREAGFNTTDSGDGSKYPHMGCAVPWPMIAIFGDEPENMIEDRVKLKELLPDTWSVEASYDGSRMLFLCEDAAVRDAHNQKAADDMVPVTGSGAVKMRATATLVYDAIPKYYTGPDGQQLSPLEMAAVDERIGFELMALKAQDVEVSVVVEPFHDHGGGDG